MNEIGLSLVWCAVGTTFIVVTGAALYSLARRVCPPVGGTAALASLSFITVLAIGAASPWPNWLAWLQNEWARLEARTQWRRELRLQDEEISYWEDEVASPAQWDQTASQPTRSSGTSSLVTSSSGTPTSGAPSVAAPSYAALTWRRLWVGIQQTGYRKNAPHWQWPGVVGVILLTGATIGVVRLMAGVICLYCWRRIGRPVTDESMVAIVESFRRQIGCRRKVGLRESSAFVVPATVGWLKPLVLLPLEWRSWTLTERQAVLAHEIAHIKRLDYVKWLLAQFGLALHFYHPLARWLVHSLRVEQEVAADAAAAQMMGGRRLYLATLATMTLRHDTASPYWLAQGFLPTRGALWRRIDSLRNIAPATSSAAVLAGQACVWLVLFVAASGAAGLRQPGGAGEEPEVKAPNFAARQAERAFERAGRQLARLGDISILSGQGEFENGVVTLRFTMECSSSAEAAKVAYLLKAKMPASELSAPSKALRDTPARNTAIHNTIATKDRRPDDSSLLTELASELHASAKVKLNENEVEATMQSESRLIDTPLAEEDWSWLRESVAEYWLDLAQKVAEELIEREAANNN